MWLLLLKILAGVVLYGTAIEPRLVDRTEQVASIPNLPAAWEGKQVAMFADLQVGMWWANTDAARKIVRQVVRAKPAFVLVAGDFVYKARHTVDKQMLEVLDILQPIKDAGIPIYAVLGNHDYELMTENQHPVAKNYVADRVATLLDSAGVHMMDNRSVVVASASDTSIASRLYLVGLGDKWARNDLPDVAFAKVPVGAPRIVFMHDPDSFALIKAGDAPVAIAAHTHALQFDIPWLTDFYWRHFETDAGAPGVAGWLDHYGAAGNHVYVNRGVGFSGFPARVLAFPELTFFTLKRAKDSPTNANGEVTPSTPPPAR